MTVRAVLAVLALTMTPGIVLAQGCSYDKVTRTSSQCQPGQTWDTATQTCVSAVNS